MGIFGKKTKEEEQQAAKVATPKETQKTDVVDGKKEEKKEESKETAKSTAKTDEKKSMKDLYAESAKKTSSSKKAKGTEVKDAQAYRILIKPLITEKAANLSSTGTYIFEVDVRANKIQVAKAIEEVYGVKPVRVNIINMQGKKVVRGRTTGQRRNWRKAFITLAKGDSIQVYEGV